jgi:hypothetical protein
MRTIADGSFHRMRRMSSGHSAARTLGGRPPQRHAAGTMTNRLVTAENRKWWTLAAVGFGLFMIMLDNTVVNVSA